MDTQQSVFPDFKMATHMPFFNGTTLAFCWAGEPVEKAFPNHGLIWKAVRRNPALAKQFQSVPKTQVIRYRAWKLAWCDWASKTIRPIDTGFSSETIECSPAFYWEGGQVHLSFVAGIPQAEGMSYRLYQASGPGLDRLGKVTPLPIPSTSVGFLSPQHLCRGEGTKLHLVEKASGVLSTLQTGFGRIARATFVADDPSKLLITGIIEGGRHLTVLHELGSGATQVVMVDGDVYKSTLYRDQLVFTQKLEGFLESRELRTGNYTLASSPIVISKGS